MNRYGSVVIKRIGVYDKMDIYEQVDISKANETDYKLVENKFYGLKVLSDVSVENYEKESYVPVILDNLGENPFVCIITAANFIDIVINEEAMLCGESYKHFKFEKDSNYEGKLTAIKDCIESSVTELEVNHIYTNITGATSMYYMYLGKHNTLTIDLKDNVSFETGEKHVFCLAELIGAGTTCEYGIITVNEILRKADLTDCGALRDRQFKPLEFLAKANIELENRIVNKRCLNIELPKIRIYLDENGLPLGGIDLDAILIMLRMKDKNIC